MISCRSPAVDSRLFAVNCKALWLEYVSRQGEVNRHRGEAGLRGQAQTAQPIRVTCDKNGNDMVLSMAGHIFLSVYNTSLFECLSF
jgi:hypothetical protein